MTNKTTLPQIMTNAEVSEALKIHPATTRSRIHRLGLGKSSPSFPQPMKKIAGAWIWDSNEVQAFLAAKEAS